MISKLEENNPSSPSSIWQSFAWEWSTGTSLNDRRDQAFAHAAIACRVRPLSARMPSRMVGETG